MDTSENNFIQLAQQISAIGAQSSKAYEAAQAELRLETILTPISLATTEGVGLSLAKLDQLSALTAAHRDMFKKFMTAAIAQLTNALNQMPEARAAQHRDAIVRSLNWNLDAQGRFYVNREKWIEAATAICHLIDDNRHAISFLEECIGFSDDGVMDHFNQLVATADDIHVLEVQQNAERLSRIHGSMAVIAASRR